MRISTAFNFCPNRLLWQLLVCVAAAFCFSEQAFADAATHNLTVTTETYPKTDCDAKGACVPECSVKGALRITKFGPKMSVPIDIQIWYKTDHVDTGEAAISLTFEDLVKGKKLKSQGQAPGYACKDVEVKRIVVECSTQVDQKCPGFYYVQIPNIPELKIKRQKIEGK